MRIAALLLAGASLGACVSASDCYTSIPEDLRADTVRFVVDKHLCDLNLIPHDVLNVAYGLGLPYENLTDDRKKLLAPYAANYALCLRQRVDRN